MILTCQVFKGQQQQPEMLPFEFDETESVELLMVMLEDVTGIAVKHQRLCIANGRRLVPEASLQSQLSAPYSRDDGSVVVTVRDDQYASSTSSSAPPASAAAADQLISQLFAAGTTAATRSTPPPPPPNPDELIAQLFASSAAAVPPRLVVDPDDPEVQRRAYEAIQQRNLEENLMSALEYTPEAFARVVMLYVPCTVNHQPVTAFIDSGAQMSVMSEDLAETCGLMRLLDRRMSGVARGVGQCKILGRVHMAMVHLGGLVLPFSITVLEQRDSSFLIGLDQLKRHQMIIDLQRHALRIGDDVSIPFLGEGELPAHCRNTNVEEEQTEGSNSKGEGAETRTQAPPPPPQVDDTATGHTINSFAGKVQRLMEMTNMSRVECEAALSASNGDEDAAALLLLDGSQSLSLEVESPDTQ